MYCTVRQILYQMGGIQSISSLPSDPTFNQFDNHYNMASYKRICDEFGMKSSSDFQFTHGKNNGLGSIYIGVSGHGPVETGAPLSFIEPDAVAYSHYVWFAPSKASGFMQAGLSRINQSIKAFVDCILGSQVSIQSSILSEGGRVKEA